jgi:hypothetical protein
MLQRYEFNGPAEAASHLRRWVALGVIPGVCLENGALRPLRPEERGGNDYYTLDVDADAMRPDPLWSWGLHGLPVLDGVGFCEHTLFKLMDGPGKKRIGRPPKLVEEDLPRAFDAECNARGGGWPRNKAAVASWLTDNYNIEISAAKEYAAGLYVEKGRK